MIGMTGRFQTRLTPADCAARLRSRFNPFLLPGKADSSGFWVAKGWRTLVRARETFALQSSGVTLVDYRTELHWRLLAITAAITLSSLIVVALALIALHLSVALLWPFFPAVILVGVTSAYISMRQAAWLDSFVRRELEQLDRV